MATIKDLAQLQGIEGLDAIIELYTLDLSSLDATQKPFRFCNWSQAGGQSLSYAGQTYEPVPVECTGFEINSQSAPSEPRMQVSNVGLTWTGLANRWDDLVGCKLIRRRVLRRYLDDGATPSPTGHWPDEPWFIEQKVSENKLSVTFALSTAFALDDVKLPKRLALRYTCSWTYRGEGCGYTGMPLANAKDQPLGNPMDPNLRLFFDALGQFYSAGDSVRINQDRYRQAEAHYNQVAGNVWKLQEERYENRAPFYSYVYFYAPGTEGGALGYGLWNGIMVPVSTGTYRAAATGGNDYPSGAMTRPIQRWAIDQASIDAAQVGLDAARVNLQASMAGQEAWRQSTLAWKAAADAVRDPRDQCSKTLKGCRARWVDHLTGNVPALPTSAFPGLQIG